MKNFAKIALLVFGVAVFATACNSPKNDENTAATTTDSTKTEVQAEQTAPAATDSAAKTTETPAEKK